MLSATETVPAGASPLAVTPRDPYLRALVWSVLALTALRVVGLVFAPVDLHGDEAQYWSWSRSLEWGYYSKPPLIAWSIAFTTGLFGNAEWAVRLSSPLAHGLAALFIGLLARDLFSPKAGLLAGLLYATMPAVWLSSAIASTDALLLPAWAGALFAFNRLVNRPSLAWGAGLGAALGVAFLAKYAAIYFLIGAALAMVIDPRARRALFSPAGAAAAIVALLILAPNLAWNAANDFETVGHTAENADWDGDLFDIAALGEFLAGQFGVFGPLSFALLVWALVDAWRARLLDAELGDRLRTLSLFVLPALAIVGTQAFISKANANWAAVSYVAGVALVAGWALARGRERLLTVALAINVAVGLLFAATALAPGFADYIGAANAFKRTRGWEETAQAAVARFQAGDDGRGYVAVAVDNRLLFHELEFYARDEALPLRMWVRWAEPKNHAETAHPLSQDDGDPVLVFSERPREHARIAADFARLEPKGEIVIDLGGGKERRLAVFSAYGFAPLPRGPEYEARWR